MSPGDRVLTIDVDSTICEVHGEQKQGARYGHTRQCGYHPLLAIRADTGEIVGARLRGGASRAGNVHFIAETIHRVRRAGAKGPIMIRTDAGFWSYALIKRLKQLGVDWSVTVPQYQKVKDAAEAIPDIEWEQIPYTKGGEAQVADTLLLSKNRPVVRLVIRRTRLTDPAQQRLWPQWRHHVFATSTDHDPVEADRSHRAHARCELAIRDIKAHSGLSHLPSGRFAANAAWLAVAALAHNIYRWTAAHSGTPSGRLVNGNTVHQRLYRIPGRIVNHGRKLILRLPHRWPWAKTYHNTLTAIRSIPQLC